MSIEDPIFPPPAAGPDRATEGPTTGGEETVASTVADPNRTEADGAAPAARRPRPMPATIGPYRIVGRLGDGGMGVVYRAEQDVPIRRTVAVKVVRAGHDSEQVIARFEAERQALARMDHPHVAKVLDAGTDVDGRPYFVMELVPGVSVTRFCDERRLSLRERLAVFLQVCDAIAHAHTKAILHRDIKDSNVLAYEADGAPWVKVIDFGIAKAMTADRLSDKLEETQVGRPIGTYGSMSPEQVAGSADVDTRTDVYALGVLLYELLCGAKPFDGTLRPGLSELDVQRLIRDVEPPRPSTRLSTSADSSRVAADVRQTSPPELARRLRSELEWVPMKAVRKERERRYDSVQQLADDVRNYLAGRPLIAGPDTRGYKVGKFVRRNKGAIATALAILLSLILGIVGTSVGLAGERRQRLAAQRERADALAARDNSAAVALFLTDDVLAAASPTRTAHGFDSTARQLLVKTLILPAADAVGRRFKGKPLVEAAIRQTLAVTLNDLGDPAAALPHAKASYDLRRSALGPDHPDAIESLNTYGLVLAALGRWPEAEPELAEGLERSRRVLGPDAAGTLQLLSNYAHVLASAGRSAAAEPLALEAWDRGKRTLGPDDPATMTYLNNYAGVLSDLGHPDRAEPLYAHQVEVDRRLLGDDHIDTMTAIDNDAAVLCLLGHPDRAEPLSKEAYDRRLRVLGENHPDTIQSLNNYAYVLDKLGRPDKAAPLAWQAWQKRRKLLGPDADETVTSEGNLALDLVHAKDFANARPLYKHLWEHNRDARGPADPSAVRSAMNYGRVLEVLRQWHDAERLYQGVTDACAAAPAVGPGNDATKRAAVEDANCLDQLGRGDDAAAVRHRFGLTPTTTAAATTAAATTAPAAH